MYGELILSLESFADESASLDTFEITTWYIEIKAEAVETKTDLVTGVRVKLIWRLH